MKPVVDTRTGVMLYLEEVSVSFDGFQALNKLSLTIDEGELRCLIGANGAGKTTMMDVITGRTRPDSGQVWFGQNVDLLKYRESDVAQVGIGRKFQKPTVFESHTVVENLRLAIMARKQVLRSLRFRVSQRQHQRIDELLVTIGLEDHQQQLAGTLSHGQKQWLEIGMLLAQDPRLLLVDEPVAGMTPKETEKTAELLQSLAGDHTILVVEHDMAFVRSIANQVTVLHEGAVLAEGSMQEIQNNDDVIRVYLGE
ncbi:MAG: urea ABC transporter ATP-binding protein UrtD [Pseudomonadota bacterium]